MRVASDDPPGSLTGDISDGVALPTEAGHQHLIVLLHVVQTAVPRHERRDLLAVLDQLDTHALANSGVRLLGLHTATRGGGNLMSLGIDALVRHFMSNALVAWMFKRQCLRYCYQYQIARKLTNIYQSASH